MVLYLLISLGFWHLAHSLPNIVDYVIVGGGTSGLTIANRLSERPDLTIAVIEAGGDERNNPNVTSVAGFGLAFNTPIDWQYETTAQTHAGNRVIEYHSGKALGGTSTINGWNSLSFLT